MSWFYLLIAALFEVGWPFGLKMADILRCKNMVDNFCYYCNDFERCILYLVQKEIPIGTAYAVWTE